MRIFRKLLRKHNYPRLFLPIQRGPLHGFYHFFIGYFVPLFIAKHENSQISDVVVDARALNPWFELLPGHPVAILDSSDALKVMFHAHGGRTSRGYRLIPFVGWDKSERFAERGFKRSAEVFRRELQEQVDAVDTTRPRILVLGRDFTPDYYGKNLPKRYGTAKRDIPNLRKVCEILSGEFDLEYFDPAEWGPLETIAKCNSAQLIIGQHGAALTNIFFMQPGSRVLEIGWPEISDPTQLDMYRKLSAELGLTWKRAALQAHRFDEVNPDLLSYEISAILN